MIFTFLLNYWEDKMKNDFFLLSDEDLSIINGGISGSTLTTPGHTVEAPSGLVSALNIGSFTGIFNGNAPFTGSRGPVSIVVTP